jgi:hypothetical protein
MVWFASNQLPKSGIGRAFEFNRFVGCTPWLRMRECDATVQCALRQRNAIHFRAAQEGVE